MNSPAPCVMFALTTLLSLTGGEVKANTDTAHCDQYKSTLHREVCLKRTESQRGEKREARGSRWRARAKATEAPRQGAKVGQSVTQEGLEKKRQDHFKALKADAKKRKLQARTKPARKAKKKASSKLALKCAPGSVYQIGECIKDRGNKGVHPVNVAKQARESRSSHREALRIGLEGSLQSPKVRERTVSLQALGELGDSKSFNAVLLVVQQGVPAAESATSREVSAAAVALGKIAGYSGTHRTAAVNALKKLASQSESNSQVFDAAVEGMGFVNTAHSAKALSSLVNPETKDVRYKKVTEAVAKVTKNIETQAEYENARVAIETRHREEGMEPTPAQGVMIARSAGRMGKRGIPEILTMLEIAYGSKNSDQNLSPRVRTSLARSLNQNSTVYRDDSLVDRSDRLVYTSKLFTMIPKAPNSFESKMLSASLGHLVPELNQIEALKPFVVLASSSQSGDIALGRAMSKFQKAAIPYQEGRELLARVDAQNSKRTHDGQDVFSTSLWELVASSAPADSKIGHRMDLVIASGTAETQTKLLKEAASLSTELESASEESLRKIQAVQKSVKDKETKAAAERLWEVAKKSASKEVLEKLEGKRG